MAKGAILVDGELELPYGSALYMIAAKKYAIDNYYSLIPRPSHAPADSEFGK